MGAGESVRLSNYAVIQIRGNTSQVNNSAANLAGHEHTRHQHASVRETVARHATTGVALDMLATCLDTQGAQAAAMACVSELAVRFGCVRVSYGRLDGRQRLRLVAMSN
ncbi:MAG: hypothetical protein WBN23_08080, partial [Woeseia sp.]